MTDFLCCPFCACGVVQSQLILRGYELLAHIANENLAEIKVLLSPDRNIIDFQDSNGYNPLLLATELNNMEIVKYLLSFNPNPNPNPNLNLVNNQGNSVFNVIKNKRIEQMLRQAEIEPQNANLMSP